MKKITSINPANGDVVGEIIASTSSEIIKKIELANIAKLRWKAMGVKERIRILQPLERIFKEKQEEIALLTTREIGKPISESLDDFYGDFIYLTDFLTNGEKYIDDEVVFSDGKAIHRIIYEPRGVVVSIAPWNYPFSNFIWSVIPNLIVGNTVVFKHSEECPMVAKILEEAVLSLKDLPEGVFSVVYGDAEEGALLAAQQVDMIWFTGSSSVGCELAATAGNKQIKAVLEMGGSNPALILEGEEIDNNMVERLYKGRFTNCGQVCDAIKRLLVHHSLFEEVIEKLSHRIKKIKIGDPTSSDTELGPLVSMRQLKILESQVNDALEKGATLVTGGKYLQELSGAYYAPTIITNIKKDMRIWQEEVFGPVLPIVAFENDEEAIQLANDTRYGLGAVIYSKDIIRARDIASKIDAGCIDINNGSHWQPCTPFGGYKASGMGREHGRHGFQELCQIKVIAE